MPVEISEPTLEICELPDHRLEIALRGDWVAELARPPADDMLKKLKGEGGPEEVGFATDGLGRWDSLLLTLLKAIEDVCKAKAIRVDRRGLPLGIRGMLELADAMPEQEGVRRPPPKPGLLETIGLLGIASFEEAFSMLAFIGEAAVGFVRFVLGKARYRRVELLLLLQECGVNALPIVSLISFLVGMILAFVGSVQLSKYGAQVYIADMVGLGMAREMGALMTAIIMAGRTGAAFAAQLGSMQVNEEIDALKTMGFSEMEFLVVPRMLALILMMPLLCVYADLMGIAGGGLVSYGLFDISLLEYSHHLLARLKFQDFAVGVGKSVVFGVLVAVSGCMRGMQCGRSSQAVGMAATSAVVTGIVMIVSADAVLTLIVITLHW
jgi:phospholipid/cholesterol/gamma-HCH transport system permease protein